MKKLIIFLMILSAQSVFAQWEATNWKSDPLTSEVYPSGDTIIIVEEKAFISYDKGVTWENFFKDSEEIPFYSLLISNNKIFLRSENKGLLFSSDFGKTWEERNSELFKNYAPRLYMNGDILWGTFSGGELGGIYLSTDFGKNWSLKNNGLPNSDKLYINTVAFNGEKIFLGTWNGVYISSDMGENWILKNEGLPEYPAPAFIVFNKTGSIFLILEDTSEGYNKFFVSNDNGETWIEKDNEIVDGWYSIDYTSLNDTIIVQVGENFYMSDDFGDNWKKLNQFKNDEWETYSLKSSGSDLYIIMSGLLFKSTDLGESWVELKPKNFKYGMVNSIAATKDKLILFSDRLSPNLNPSGIYLSSDLGNSWNLQIFEDTLKGIVNTFSYENTFFISSYFGFYISTNADDTWLKKSNENKILVFDMAFSGDSIFAGVNWQGVYFSPDLGNTWESRSMGLPVKSDIYSIKILGSYLFANVDNAGIYFSADKGMNWIPINNGLPDNSLILSFTVNGNNLFAGIANKGIYISTNMGESWEPRNNGLPTKPFVKVFHSIGNTIFAGLHSNFGESGGIFISNDNGENWIKKSDGIFNENFSSFADNGEYIFAGTNTGRAGTYGDVIYKAKLSDFGKTDVKENNIISDIRIFPNPAEDYIEIYLNKGLQPLVQNEAVQIFDVLGIELISESIHPMTGSHRMNIKHLPAGVYFIRIGDRFEKFVKM